MLSAAPDPRDTSTHYRIGVVLTLVAMVLLTGRRDALLGEDRSCSRNPNLLAILAPLRHALLALWPAHFPDQSWQQIRERLHSRLPQCFKILRS